MEKNLDITKPCYSQHIWPALALRYIEVPLSLESFRFQGEYDYEYEIFSILSRARAWTSHFGGERGSRRHSRGGAASFTKGNSVNFSSKKW